MYTDNIALACGSGAYWLVLFLLEWKGVQGELETADDAPQNGRGDMGQMVESPALLPVQVI